MEDNKDIIGYDGVCPICGSIDGTIVKGKDGKYRNICRVFGCHAYHRPAPFDGYDDVEFAKNPFGSPLLKSGDCTVEKYLRGEA